MPEETPVVAESASIDEPSEKPKHAKAPKPDGNLLKRDIAFLQKKLAELEISVSEVQEGVQKIDIAQLEDFKKRVEDVEDLTMVENAAVIELKNLFEGSAKPEQPQENTQPQLEERLNLIEQKIQSMPVNETPTTSVDTSKLDENIAEIKSSFENLKSDLETKISAISEKYSAVEMSVTQPQNVDMMKEEVKNFVLASLPDYQWIKNELHSFKSYFDAEKTKIDALMGKIETEMQIPLPEKALEELEKIRNDWMINIAKIDAIEKFVQSFSNEINVIKPTLKKLETFEKLMDLQSEMAEKMETFKEYSEHIESAMSKNEDAEKNIQREFRKIKDTEKMFSQFDQSLSNLAKEVEKSKKQIEGIVSPLQDKTETLSKSIKDIQDTTMSLDKRFDTVERTISSTQDDMSALQGNMMVLEGSIKKDAGAGNEDIIRQVLNKFSRLEEQVDTLYASQSIGSQMSQFVERIVFLESRLAAMEGMMQEMPRYSPIVVE